MSGFDWALQLKRGFALVDEKHYVQEYYVDNVNGKAGAAGDSWDTALAQIGPAVTLWEAFRAAQPNIYGRGVIYIRGTGTAYTALTALPNYCDMIGVGSDPRGNGAGIASITAATGVDTVTSTGVRGLGLYNLQFTGSGTGWAMNVAIMFRSIIENCCFFNKSTGALQIVTGGGITIRKCAFGGDTVTPAIGINVGTAAGNFNQCLVEDNVIYGSTYGFVNGAYLSDGTVVKNNIIYGGTEGVRDTGTDATMAANAFYCGNYVSGADAMTFVVNTDGARTIGNHVVNGTTGAVEDVGS
jgi:hypothetical protein